MSLYNFFSIPSQTTQNANAVLENVLCDSSVEIGNAVRADPTGVLFQADASNLSTANVVGIVESKADATTCTVRISGLTPEIFLSLDVTKDYFLSPIIPGALTDSPPSAVGHVVVRIGQPYSSSQLIVSKGSLIVRA